MDGISRIVNCYRLHYSIYLLSWDSSRTHIGNSNQTILGYHSQKRAVYPQILYWSKCKYWIIRREAEDVIQSGVREKSGRTPKSSQAGGWYSNGPIRRNDSECIVFLYFSHIVFLFQTHISEKLKFTFNLFSRRDVLTKRYFLLP